MTAKQYLQSYRRLRGHYNAIVEEYLAAENDMITLKSPKFGDRTMSSAKNDPIGDIVCRLEDKKAKIGIWMVESSTKMMMIESQVREMNSINPDYYVILSLRYLLDKDWRFICEKICMSRAQANVVHGMALKEFDAIYGSTYHDL